MIRLFYLQGIFYTLTGVWPLLHMPSFLWVTGPKVDLWLVNTVGGLIAVSGLAFLFAAYRKERSVALSVVAAGQAAFLFCIDVYYVVTDVILPVYLLDAVAEAGIVAAWIGYIVYTRKPLT